MKTVILDFGSGETCGNDAAYACRMIDELSAVDTGKHRVVIKWQLFAEMDYPTRLDREVFDVAYDRGIEAGYEVTASVFDDASAAFLAGFPRPFTKLACRPDLYQRLNGSNGRGYVVSVANSQEWVEMATAFPEAQIMGCVPDYPAKLSTYEARFGWLHLMAGISDHTVGLELWRKYEPALWEKHYCLEDSTGPDVPYSITPKDLVRIL